MKRSSARMISDGDGDGDGDRGRDGEFWAMN